MNAIWICISMLLIAGLYALLFATAESLHRQAPRSEAASALDPNPADRRDPPRDPDASPR